MDGVVGGRPLAHEAFRGACCFGVGRVRDEFVELVGVLDVRMVGPYRRFDVGDVGSRVGDGRFGLWAPSGDAVEHVRHDRGGFGVR